VDASLWFVNAVYNTLIIREDSGFCKKQVYPTVKDIIHWYMEGTEYNIADG